MNEKTTNKYKNMTPEISLKYKANEIEQYTLANSNDAYKCFLKMYDADTLEYFESSIVIYLNRANKTIGWQKVSQGGLTGTVIDIRIILGTALKCGATGIIISHNHPSGNTQPSEADITLTNKIKKACDLLDINLLDHLIITKGEYYSFSDTGNIM